MLDFLVINSVCLGINASLALLAASDGRTGFCVANVGVGVANAALIAMNYSVLA